MDSPEPSSLPSCRRHLNLEDSPIRPAIDGQRIKSFEDFLNHSLQNIQLEEEEQTDRQSVPKRPFLKKGTGLVRYKPAADSPRRTRLCQSTSCQPNQRFKRCISSGSSATSSVQVLPRTTSRFPSSSGSGVSVVRKDVPFDPTLRPRSAPKQKSERCVQTSASLENLEGLLRTVRGRKEEVLRQLERSDGSSSSEWEEEDANEFDDSRDSEDEDEMQDLKETIVKPRKKVRWMKRTKASKLLSGRSKLTKPSPSPYSLHLAQSISQLENKLHYLQTRCRSSSPLKKVIADSDVMDETMALKKEVVDLNQKIRTLTDELKTLQIMTGKAANDGNKKMLEKRTKVTVHKNPSLSVQTTISRDISRARHNDESIVYFENGCTMQRLTDGTVIHTFKNGTKQTMFPDGSKLVEFSNNQMERTLPNGVKHITYPNKNYRIIYPDGSEELTTSDGTILRIGCDGTEVVILPNGEREIRCKEFTRHEYRNGIIKTVYADGTQETRYPNGRLRIKDRYDNLVVDSMVRTMDQLGLHS